MSARSQSITGLHPDSHPSELTAYIGSYRDGHPRGVPLKMETRRQWPLRVSLYWVFTGRPPDCVNSLYWVLFWWLPSGSLLKDGGSPTITARNSAMATRWVNSLYWVLHWWLPLGESPERWRLTHNDCSELTYSWSSPWRPPEWINILYWVLPWSLPSGSFLKDEGSPTMIAQI